MSQHARNNPEECARQAYADATRPISRQDGEPEDICGLCGKPGANKVPHPIHWPGEEVPDTDLVHDTCEAAECERAHSLLSDKQRRDFLRNC